MNCKCGKEAKHTAYLPMPNVFYSAGQVKEPHPVCDYHADKAEELGFRVERNIIIRW